MSPQVQFLAPCRLDSRFPGKVDYYGGVKATGQNLKRAGVIAGLSPPFEEEIRRFLQRRLRLMAGLLSAILWLLSIAFVTTLAANATTSVGEVVLAFITQFPNSVLSFLVALTTGVYLVLRLRPLPGSTLAWLDALLLFSLVAPSLFLYARRHGFSFSDHAFIVPFLMLFLLTRAILIPSTGLRTALLSLPAPIGVLLIQLWHGASFAFPDMPYRESHFLDTIVQNQVCLLGATAAAIVASRVNLSLRRRNYDARHVGQYRLEEKIGEGAFGEVFRATHSLLKRATAIKFLRPELAGEQALARFEQEVQLASSLTHPNNISIYDYGYTADGLFYYAMEYLRGATLKDIVSSAGPMPPGRVIYILLQCCAALREAHLAGILHRDLKPANIYVCRQGALHDVAKILDFGLARKIHSPSGSGPILAGTPDTLAPEAWLGKNLDPRSDIYSLSIVGYFMLSASMPFEAESIAEMANLHVSKKPTPPEGPEDLVSVILDSLSKEPDDRPPLVEEMAKRLRNCADHGSWGEAEAAAWWYRTDWSKIVPSTGPLTSETSEETLVLGAHIDS